MNFCISIGAFNTKYFIYCALIAILELYINFGIYKINKKILNDHQIFDIFCYYFGYLLNIIPTWFVKENYIDNNPDNKHMTAKDIIKFFSICFILLLTQLIEIFSNIINKYNDNDNENKQNVGYKDNFILYLIIIMFIEVRFFFKNIIIYKHQKISFLTFFIIEIIKTIYFVIKENNSKIYDFLTIIIGLFYSLSLSIYYIYIDGLMKHKYISPYKCSFMIGACFAPLLMILYLIILFTNNFDFNFNVFKSFGDLEAINIILLISYPFAAGALGLLILKTINDFSLFHLYIPFILKKIIGEIVESENKFSIIIFLISSFLIELIMILVFLEIIEIRICGLNKNTKRNIELRACHESFSLNEDEYIQLDENNFDKEIN